MRLFLRVISLSFCVWFLSIRVASQQLNWAHRVGETGIDISNTVYTDNAGNVYIAGKFSGTNVDFDPSAAFFPLSSAGSTDAFVAKYDANGQFIWAFRFGGANRDDVASLTTDQNGNVYLTGYFRGANIDFNPGAGVANLTSNGDAGVDPEYGGDIFIAKYNAAGQYQWAFNVGGFELYDTGISIATDAAGNVYAGGYFTNTADFDPSAGIAYLNSAVGGTIFLAKYTTNGVYQWALNLGDGTTNNSIFDVKADAGGNVYTTGYFRGVNIDFDPSAAFAPLSSNGGYELFVAKYNTNGQYQFAFSAGGTGSDVGRGLALDNGGNIYLTGDFYGSVDFDPGAGTAMLTSNGQGDAVLAKYSPIGQYLWAFNFGGIPNEYGGKVIVDGGHVFVTGSFSGTADFDPSAAVDNLTSAGGYDIYLGKYTLNGEYLCSFRVGGAGDDGGHSLASNAPNVFYLTGTFTGANIDFDPTPATSNLSSAGSNDIFLAKYTWPDNLRPTGTLAGDNICAGEQAQLTFNATAGTGPFSVVYTNGTANIQQTNVQSGVPFNITPNPSATTTYTLVSVRDALKCSETNFISGTATVTVTTCAVPSPCDQSLSLPAQGSKVTVGDVDVTGNQLTVEAMFNRNAPLNNGVYYGHLVSKHTDQNNVNYALLPNGCEITTSGSGYKAIFQTCVPELGKTYHVAMVYDGVTLKFYRNGFLMSQVACTGNLVNNDLLTTIGQIASGADPFDNQFLGYTNEVRIWNVARTQAQIATYMNQSLPNPATQTGLRAYYSFNDLSNKQGNAAFEGTLHGNAAMGKANPDCAFVPSSCNTVPDVIASFTAPDTVCVNTPVNITNISLNATNQYWSFCAADANKIPTAVDLGNPGASLSFPVFSDIVNDNGNYYVFVSNNWPGGLVRLDFGNSLLNAPVVVNLGNIGGIIPNTIEGIQVVKNEGRWYAIMVGGDVVTGGIPSRIIKIDFGVNITNAAPVGTNWGNIGNLAYPVDLHLFQENGGWYGFTVNAQNNTITRFNFSNSFTNVPTGVNLGNLGGLNYPTGINAVKDNGNWYVFITNDVVNSFLVRLNFGNSLLNVPTANNLGNPGNVLHKTRDIYIMKACDQITGLAVNGDGYSDLVRLDFNNNITATPTGTSLGNTGNMNFPHSISRLFRAGNDLYSFVTNVNNNNITRIRFEGCANSSIPNSALLNPPSITYSTPGTYNINLTVDEGLPTQTSFCKQVVVKDCTVPIIPDFDIPDTVCVNTPVNITNNTIGATSHYWSFCSGDINKTPIGTNLGNIGGLLSQPVFMDYAIYNGNYYGFSINHYPGKLVRLNFGNSLLNAPTATDLGNFGGIIPVGYGAEGIQIVQNEGKWYAIIVGGYTPSGSTPRVLKIDFGANLSNAAPVATDWGNIGNLYQPIDLHVFKENNNWYGLTINAENNTITRFSFTNSFDNVPTAVNLGGFGMLDYPTGIYAINDNGFWRVFITNNGSNSRLVRLDFGSSLLNAPVAVDLGGIGNSNGVRDLTILKDCDQVVGFAVNGTTNSLYQLNFATLTSVPTVTNLGNTGNLSTPHSISKLFRVNDDLYSFITNVGNNTITRLRFAGCTNSNPANSALQNPPPIIYNTPGTYNINLTIDDGLPTQSSVCKQVVVRDCNDSTIINDYTPILSFDPCKNSLKVEDASKFKVGDTVLMIQMKGAVIDSTNTAAFGTITNYRNAGNYEFNYVKVKTGNLIELLNVVQRQYDIPVGKVQLIRVPFFQNYTAASTLTCLPWDGNKGGVLVFNVQNTLTLDENIDVSGKGFKGGTGTNSGQMVSNCFTNGYIYPSTSIIAAAKGESITTISNNISNGKGAPAGAGGGGLDHNSGGGGGGNGGIGGFGGYQLEPCGNSPFDNRGVGGRNLAYNNVANKIFLGSGGGAGHANNPGNQPSSGGNGGGIVIITAQNLQINNSSKIIASGNNAPEYTVTALEDCHDGMGGGGAGGTILLNIPVALNNIPVEIKGGKGANMTGSVPLGGRIGAGGGGSGGVFWAVTPALLPNIVVNNSGGTNGVLTQDANSSWGATPGQNGISLFNLQLQVDDVLFKRNIDSVRIRKTAIGCSSFSFEGLGYTNTYSVNSWQWYFGDGGVASTQNTNHTYSSSGNYIVKLVITDINGCKDSITAEVTAIALNFDFSYKQNICDPLAVQFNGLGNSLDNSFWDFGDGSTIIGNANPIHTYTATGDYLVKFSIGNGICVDTIRKTISINVLWDNLILTPDTTICYGAVKQLRTVPSLSFCWTPVTYLDNPNSANPITSAPQDIIYHFTAEVTGANLINNSDFSSGNSGFTSQYNFANTNTIAEQYFIGANLLNWNTNLSACKDHTSGNGNMMMVNGSLTPDVDIWKQTVNVVPNTNYAFSIWVQALQPVNPAQLQFTINGKDAGALITAGLPACTWTQFYTTWNTGDSTKAIISIVNKNTVQESYFALDDISFAPVFVKRDSVKIKVERPLVKANSDTTICTGKPVQLNATGAESYTWFPADDLSGTNMADPVASPDVSTQYIVTGITMSGCLAKDTVNINVFTKPVIVISNDTTICSNAQVQLSATGGVDYIWSPAVTLNNHLIANPVASPVSDTKYHVVITDGNACEYLDSVEVTFRPDAVFSISSGSTICRFDSVRLNAAGGDIYTWQPSDGLNNAGIPNPVASPLSTTEYSVKISEALCNQSAILKTTVTVMPQPDIIATKSNDIDCSNDRSQLNATGGDQYVWKPAFSLNNPNISNPVATPISTTDYIVTGTSVSGCKGYDTVTVKVDKVNKNDYLIANAFTPNNDGLNDCYGIKYWGVIEQLEFSIYNRWGERIFFTKNAGQCWDGTYKGVKQDGGVYVYMIKAKTMCEAEVFRKGTFVLVR